MKAIATAREYSNKRIKVMREALVGEIASDSFSIVLGGSYARREASDESDLDFYVIATPAGVPRAKRSLPRIREVLASVIKAPTKNGLFGTVHHSREMLKNIGGTKDTNEKFTIRTLFLTEGEWLSNEKLFAATRQSLTARYLQPYLKQSQLARFFLNDLMRCYRTICVDFENKTFEKEKPWGPRNIKLRFSRKLLYFSGAIVAAEVADLPADGKVERMLDLLALPPIERLQHVCGTKANNALRIYDFFLSQLSQPKVRSELEQVEPHDGTRDSNRVFRQLKNKGHEFSFALIDLLFRCYPKRHPIHEAMIF